MRVQIYIKLFCRFCCLIILISSISCESNITTNYNISEPLIGINCRMKNLGIFYNEQEIFDILSDKMNRNRPNVSDLVKVYKEKCCTLVPTRPTPTKPRRPFIVIESNYRPPRKMVAKQLADILGAKYVSVPPDCLRDFLYAFDYSSVLRRAYFGLSIYAADHEVRARYHDIPVIVSGYWADQTTFSIAKEFQLDTIPEVGSLVYNWPTDLLKPDVSFLMSVTQQGMENLATNVYPDLFHDKRLEAFRRMRRPRLREIDGDQNCENVLTQMQSKMLNVFSNPRWKRKNVRY